MRRSTIWRACSSASVRTKSTSTCRYGRRRSRGSRWRDDERIARAAAILGAVARVVQPTNAELNLAGAADVVDAIVAVISRHPMAEDELVRALARWNPDQVETTLQELAASGAPTRLCETTDASGAAPARVTWMTRSAAAMERPRERNEEGQKRIPMTFAHHEA